MTNKVITISRQFGSGGRTIGKKVAEKLGIPYYDKELVDQVAKESGFSHEFIEEIGEYASVTSSFLFNIAVSAHPMGLIDTMSVSDKLYVCQTNVIRDLAEKGPCVIVGRCADFILKDRPDTLHIFIHSDMEHRAERIVRLYGETKQTPQKRLQEKDSKRKVYYKHYTNCNWAKRKTTTSASTPARWASTSAPISSAMSRSCRNFLSCAKSGCGSFPQPDFSILYLFCQLCRSASTSMARTTQSAVSSSFSSAISSW